MTAITQQDGTALFFDRYTTVLEALPSYGVYFDVTTDIEDVNSAVAAWEAEQARIAEEAARAAEEAAVTIATPATSNSGVQIASNGIDHDEWVYGSGWQAEIDLCAGSVDVSAKLRVPVLAEHSNCGGSSFPTWAGAVVDVHGVFEGRYRVIGVVAVLNGNIHNSNDVPRGYDLLFQTCVNGYTEMRFIALERIG